MRKRRVAGIAAGLGATLLAALAVALLALATPPGAPDLVARHTTGLLVYADGSWREPGDTAFGDRERVVLLVHGLDEPGDIWDDLTPALVGAGCRPIRFDYPNDQAVELSGALLADALAGLRARDLERLSIVAHSMGGLVTLDALTRADAPGPAPRVDRLITIGTPFAGSPWSGMRWAAEVREQAQRLAEGGADGVAQLRRFLDDGRGEAGADLAPGSPLLADLRSRPRPEGLAITCIRGRLVTPPPGSPPDLVALADTLGDGVVPVASGVLPGVADVVELGANHRSMVRRLPLISGPPVRPGDDSASPGAAPPPAIAVILERLGRDATVDAEP